ncbi:MAG: hypothetical protein R3C14_13780 [Caldilineaceae bacterium]
MKHWIKHRFFQRTASWLANEPMMRPNHVAQITHRFFDSLERRHQIGVYVPTTLAVSQQIDTTEYVNRTLSFLGERFGGATSTQASGVWKSAEIGLVGETVYIVRAYATEADMNRYLDEIIAYIKEIKSSLKQETIAFEVDQKLALL